MENSMGPGENERDVSILTLILTIHWLIHVLSLSIGAYFAVKPISHWGS
jgi:hypothetical protein